MSYASHSNYTIAGVSLKSQLLKLIGLTLSAILNWKFVHRFPAATVASFLIDFIASIMISFSMVCVKPIKSTYNPTQDNLPFWKCAIAINLLVCGIFYLVDIYVTWTFVTNFYLNIGLMSSIAQLLMERNIRLRLQRDQQLGIAEIPPTFKSVRVAILFTFLSQFFNLIQFVYIYPFHSIVTTYNARLILSFVIYYDFGRYEVMVHFWFLL
jgi:hypothetical protein